MPRTNTDAAIRARVDAFVEDLTGLIREAALEAVQEALVRDGSLPRAAATRVAGPKRRKKAGRRSRRAVDTATVLEAIRAHQGERTEVIAKSMGTDSKALKPAIDELVADGRVSRRGKARGTTLHIGGGGSGSGGATRKKAGRRKKAARRKTARSKKK